jgi:hypothetical protein
MLICRDVQPLFPGFSLMLLVLVEPIQIGVQVFLVEALQAENVTGGVTGGQTYRRKTRALIDDAGDGLPERWSGV